MKASPRYAAHRIFLSWNDDEISSLSLQTVRWPMLDLSEDPDATEQDAA